MKKIFALLFVFSSLVFSQEFEPDRHTVALWHFNENNGTKVSD
ncbi:MAG: hypothetical protein P4L45_08900 [Ignavibacteriaceae bacterium]|nr:hypothetical protein [Ignavibacteriaceae bacterium]